MPVVVIPLCNPRGYRNNWSYPNTPGDAECLLPDLETGTKPRAAAAARPETRALTEFVLRLSKAHPPRLVLDLHEDELSTEGGYVYSRGRRAADHPAVVETPAFAGSRFDLRVAAHGAVIRHVAELWRLNSEALEESAPAADAGARC